MNPRPQTNLVDGHITALRQLSSPAAHGPKPADDHSVVARLRRKVGQRVIELGVHIASPRHGSKRLRLLQ
jgi:hypothetical protein